MQKIKDTRLDKINKKTVFEIDTLRAGFSKISITPFLNYDLSTSLSEKLMPYPENVYLQALRLNNLIWFLLRVISARNGMAWTYNGRLYY